jgi:hypothetical protein
MEGKVERERRKGRSEGKVGMKEGRTLVAMMSSCKGGLSTFMADISNT